MGKALEHRAVVATALQFQPVTTRDRGPRGEITGLSLTSRLWIKRFFDLGVALGVVALCLPALLILSLLVALSSRGPVFFRQVRVGQDRRTAAPEHRNGSERRKEGLGGRPFQIYKFRTMYVDAPAYAATPTDARDPRIVPFGRFLRRTCLDELPQLLNVIKGDMSLVGPRPEMPFIVANYDRIQRRRLKVKPGITGPWQIKCGRDDGMHDVVGWDLDYVMNWSLRKDLMLLVETFLFAIRRRNV